MDMQWAKVAAKLLLLLNTDVFKILVPENNDTALGNQEGQLVFLQIIQLRKLETTDLGSDNGRYLRDLQMGIAFWKEIGLGLIRNQSTVVELKWLKWWKRSGLIVYREISAIIILAAS